MDGDGIPINEPSTPLETPLDQDEKKTNRKHDFD